MVPAAVAREWNAHERGPRALAARGPLRGLFAVLRRQQASRACTAAGL